MADKPKKPTKQKDGKVKKGPKETPPNRARATYDFLFDSLSTRRQYEEVQSLLGWLVGPVCVVILILVSWRWDITFIAIQQFFDTLFEIAV